MGGIKSSEFTSENLRSYARRCMELGTDMAKYEFDTLLIPSRGAVPIFLGSLYALKYLGNEEEEYKTLAERMTAPLSIRKGILPRAKEREIDKKDIEILPYPLTADVNIERYFPHSKNTHYSEQIREFSVKVLKSFFKKPYERIEDPYFKFFSSILTKIEKRDKLALEYLTYPQIKNLAMIDTIISGRAAATILRAFGEEGVYPYSFLVVDRNGERIKGRFKDWNGETRDFAEELGWSKYGNDHWTKQCNDEQAEKCFLHEKRGEKTVKVEIKIDRRKNYFYPVNRIMTEDTGSALQGVSAITYPIITAEGNWQFFPVLSKVGAGTWYAMPREKKHKMTFYSFINTLKKAIDIECADYLGEGSETIKKKEELFEYKRKNLVNLLETTKLPDITLDNIAEYYPEYDKSIITDIYESSAKVVQIAFTKEFTDTFIEEFKEEIGISTPKKERLEKLL